MWQGWFASAKQQHPNSQASPHPAGLWGQGPTWAIAEALLGLFSGSFGILNLLHFKAGQAKMALQFRQEGKVFASLRAF